MGMRCVAIIGLVVCILSTAQAQTRQCDGEMVQDAVSLLQVRPGEVQTQKLTSAQRIKVSGWQSMEMAIYGHAIPWWVAIFIPSTLVCLILTCLCFSCMMADEVNETVIFEGSGTELLDELREQYDVHSADDLVDHKIRFKDKNNKTVLYDELSSTTITVKALQATRKANKEACENVYLPKKMAGYYVLAEEQGSEKWRGLPKWRQCHPYGEELIFRKTKNFDDVTDRHLPCGVRLPGKDQGDGWVRFQITAPKTKFGFSVGDRVTWTYHDSDVPLGAVGTVVGMVDNPARVAVDFATNPDGTNCFKAEQLKKANIREKTFATVEEFRRWADSGSLLFAELGLRTHPFSVSVETKVFTKNGRTSVGSLEKYYLDNRINGPPAADLPVKVLISFRDEPKTHAYREA